MENYGVHGAAPPGHEGRVHPGRDRRDPGAVGRFARRHRHHRQLALRRPHSRARRRLAKATQSHERNPRGVAQLSEKLALPRVHLFRFDRLSKLFLSPN